MKKILFLVGVILTGTFLSGAVVEAASTWIDPDTGQPFDGGSGSGWNIDSLSVFGLPDASVYDIVANFLYWILAILGIAGVIGFALSGVMYLLAAGNEDMIKNAKNAMTASILGVIVGLSGLVIVQAVYWALRGVSFF